MSSCRREVRVLDWVLLGVGAGVDGVGVFLVRGISPPGKGMRKRLDGDAEFFHATVQPEGLPGRACRG